MKGPDLTDREKQELLTEHFYYEVKMLGFSVARLSGSLHKRGSLWHRNMAIEACLLHARNLREFLYSEDKLHETDARAYEFVKDRKKWEEARPDETNCIKKVRERANTELAHLTYRRYAGTAPEKGWDYHEIQRDFFKVINAFLDHLPQKYMGEGLREVKQMCVQVATSTRKQVGLSRPAGATTTTVYTEAVGKYNNYRAHL